MATDPENDPGLEAVREQRVGLRAAMDTVERSIVAAASGRIPAWAETVREAMERLGNAFEHHVKVTEAPEGLLAEVVDEAPRLSHRVQVIKDDHVTIAAAIERLEAKLRNGGVTDSDGVSDLSAAVLELLVRIVQHRHLGADLVYEAYNVDIDAAD